MPDYVEYILELKKEWPEDRLRKYALECLRESCQFAQRKKAEIEIENKEARMKGMSYKERQKYTVKLEALDGLFKKWRERGIYYSKNPLVLHELVQAEDLSYIQAVGIERHLRCVITW